MFGRRSQGYAPLTSDDGSQLLKAGRTSSNRQLKYIMSLLMLTGARTSEILNMRWTDLDLDGAVWRIPRPNRIGEREVRLTASAVALLRQLREESDGLYVVPNPLTGKPYRSLTKSWDVAKRRADLDHLELDDLRDCNFGERVWQEKLVPLLLR